MRHNLLTIIAIASFTFGISHSFAAVGEGSEVSCSNYGADALSCNQCFDGGTDYVGDTTGKAFDDTFLNKSSLDLAVVEKGSLSSGPVQLQSSIGIGQSSNYVTPSFLPALSFLPDGKTGEYIHVFTSGTSTAITRMTGGVLFTKVLPGADASKPAMRFEYNIRVQAYNFDTHKREGAVFDHKECAFVTARWCGDAIVGNGEVCDDGDQNGQPGKCNTLCNGTIQPPVSCDNMTATPLSGAAPLNVAVACTGTNAATYRIDCGNGITNLTNTAVCRYPTMGTYIPRCYVNGNVTSAACAKAITVTPPVACVPGTTTGPQTAPLTATSPGLCPGAQTVGGFTGTTVGTLTTYNWSCNGSAVGGACAATFNSSTAAAGVDLSLKKYASGSDAQDNATSVVVNSGSGFNYTISVANVGTGVLPASLTTVADTLPAGVTLTASPTGIGWTCITVGAGVGFSCSRNDTLAANGALFPIITIPVTATGAPAFLVNTGTVTNPNDIILTNNADPAVIALNGGLPLGPRCNTISASLASPVVPGASVTYTCTATGYTIPAANLEYRVDCGATTGTWGSSNTGTCLAPAASNATANVSCAVRDRNLPTVIFTGSSVGSCLRTVTTTGPGGPPPPTGGASHVSCINGIGSCATYNTIIACEAVAGVGNCDSADASGQARCAAKASAWTCGPGGPSGSCGDGVLQPDKGEECDVKGASWCDNNCKVIGLTTPGANPITDIWMTIPTFAGINHLGYSWLDGMPGRIAFSDNRMVLGKGTKAFTLADTVGLGIKTQYRIPLIISADKKICLQSTGDGLNYNTICTTFREAAKMNPSIQTWTRIDGQEFVMIGAGMYQAIKPNNPVPPEPKQLGKNPTPLQIQAYNEAKQTHDDWREYGIYRSNSSSSINLFKGAKVYPILGGGNSTLNQAFEGNKIGKAILSLGACSETDCGTNSVAPLVSLEVRTSAAVVASIGSSANRSLETFLNRTNPFAGFITNGSVSVNTEISTTKNNQVANIVNPVKLPTTGIKKTGPVTNVQDLEKDYALNGNKNIFAIDGDLTISCPPGKTFEMTGVRTVIVNNGNLIIKCNITYADANASWAWIANGGDIRIDNGDGNVNNNGITNLAGVYVATTGKFAPIEGRVTQAVLKVEGSMYGNAAPLFDSRLYARATSAYDILTTGTVLTYSNRALVSPPPLLSQYLGNYSVQRVIQ